MQLQTGETWMFKSRAALAATLSSNYGIYNGFELIEHEPIPGREEYHRLGKIRDQDRDWNKPGNIKDYLARLNRIRAATIRALLQTANLRFLQVDDDDVIGFLKESVDGDNAVACAIALAGDRRRNSGCISATSRSARRAPGGRCARSKTWSTGERHMLEWGGVRLRIDPAADPALLFRCIA